MGHETGAHLKGKLEARNSGWVSFLWLNGSDSGRWWHPEGNLSIGMRQLNGVYTQLFNRYNGKTGHLFLGRYKAILIQKDSHLLPVCRYVVLNPVRAKMVETPEAWKWSSYPATAGQAKPHSCLTTDWMLGQFSGKRDKATIHNDRRRLMKKMIAASGCSLLHHKPLAS